ncbi:MAG: methyltransferase domain-containing protein [Geitlerinemataceae cyanobacterium]
MSATLSDRIQQFYDTSSGLWEQMWGEHMHHGYYGADGTRRPGRKQAQIDLIEELLQWTADSLGADLPLALSSPKTAQFLDAGCGIGGSTLYLAQKFQIKGIGITLSPVQATRAIDRSREAGISGDVGFMVANAQNVPFADESFDLIWSLESGEHMPDKVAFLQECYRVLKPGGTLIFATWCHRPTKEPLGRLTEAEQKQLQEIYRLYHLPYVISLPEYETIATGLNFQKIHTADWSSAVAPFWDDVLDSALNPSAILGVLMAGWETIQGAWAIGLMRQGFASGLIRYGVLCATKS